MRASWLSSVVLAGMLMMASPFARAHDGESHDTATPLPGTTKATTQAAAVPSAEPFPVALGGSFALIDQEGHSRGPGDFGGRLPLVFFGYARCESICPVALRTMLDAVDMLGPLGDKLQPLLITVDPENETPAVLAEEVPRLHPRLIGLTGSSEEIEAARALFRVNAEKVGTNIKGNPVFAHGSYVYLLDREGKMRTLLPPILDAPTMAEKLKPYLL